jgi:hypothetical protein
LPSAEKLDAPPLLGDQTPRILTCPESATSAGQDAVDLAASVGLYLDPWQQLVLEKSLGEQPDGKWSSFEVGLVVSRQNGKGSILEARALAGLLLFGEELIVHSAHEFKTAQEAMRRLGFLLGESGVKFKTHNSHGKEGYELLPTPERPRGARIFFQSRTKSAGRGLTGDLVILDEAMILSSASMRALLPTLSARPNPQIWYTGSAVDQTEDANCYVFGGVRKRGVEASSPRLCFAEWSCTEGTDPTSRTARAQANPSMGRRISEEYIEDEYQAFKNDIRSFLVERLAIGDWPVLGAAAEPVFDIDEWDTMANAAPILRGPRTIALDRTPDGRTWALCAAQRTIGDNVHLEIGYNRSASNTEMVEYLVGLVTEWSPAALVIDQKSAAAVLKPYLLDAGIEPIITNASELAIACQGFLDAALDKQLSHTGQKLLSDAVACAVKRDLPGGGFAWDKTAGGSIAQLVAATLAHWSLLTFGTPTSLPAAPLAATRDDGDSAESDFDALSAAF